MVMITEENNTQMIFFNQRWCHSHVFSVISARYFNNKPLLESVGEGLIEAPNKILMKLWD